MPDKCEWCRLAVRLWQCPRCDGWFCFMCIVPATHDCEGVPIVDNTGTGSEVSDERDGD